MKFHVKVQKNTVFPVLLLLLYANLFPMNTVDIIKRPITNELEAFRELFVSSLKSDNPLLDNVLAYIKNRSGKMMRPILVMLVAKAYGVIDDSVRHVALSLELLHTASLVHDDVVDESSERRGQQSVNAVYNNKLSVLVGDYILATCLKHASLTKNIKLVELVSDLGQDLSLGEVIQLANLSNKEFSEEDYFNVIRRKTAALFAAAAECGAVAVGASEKEVECAVSFGEMLGIAFQIKDDIFDYFEDENIGKPTGNDMVEGKLTLPAIYVLNKMNDEALNALTLRIRGMNATKDEILSFVETVKKEGGIEYADKVMRDYRNKALDLLPEYIPQDIRLALTAYIDYVIDRKK